MKGPRPPRRPGAPAGRGRSAAGRAKAPSALDCTTLEQLPNVGPSIAADLRRLGVTHPSQLSSLDPMALYRQLCELTGARQDPCVLDTFMAAIDFMQGAEPRPWWHYTPRRKARYGPV